MPKTNPIWKDKDAIENAVASNTSLGKTLEALGIQRTNYMYKRLSEACKVFGISIEYPKKYSHAQRTPDELVFVENSPYVNNRIAVKKRALELGYITDNCSECGQEPMWNGKILTLQLDHINGKSDDHRPENLRMLCPNCHTQTETYAGKRPYRTKRCVRNHEFSSENTRIRSNGKRECLTCERKNLSERRNPVKAAE